MRCYRLDIPWRYTCF